MFTNRYMSGIELWSESMVNNENKISLLELEFI